MTKRINMIELAERIVSRTPPASYADRDQLWWYLYIRNRNKFGTWQQGIDVLTKMVEKRLIERDGVAYSRFWRENDALGVRK